jgi:hypothetical protein
MKKYLLTVFLLFLGMVIFAQNQKPENIIRFKKNEYDVGKIKQGVPVTIDLDFDNISDGAVDVESVMAPCGCTITEKPTTSTSRGKSGKIKVEFHPIQTGHFERKITVKLVGVIRPMYVSIMGEVMDVLSPESGN